MYEDDIQNWDFKVWNGIFMVMLLWTAFQSYSAPVLLQHISDDISILLILRTQEPADLFSLYRVSHETWQLVNSFECHLPYTVLDIEDFFLVKFVFKIFNSNIFYFEINFTVRWLPAHTIFLIILLVLNN